MNDVFVDGREAERLLQDPAFQKALQRMENDTVAAWKLATEVKDREACHATLHALEGIRSALLAMSGDKAMADARERTTAKG